MLAFTSSDGGRTFAAVAVLGMAANENLFLVNGRWDESAYLPAYVRRYAHLISLDNFARLLKRKSDAPRPA